MKCSGVSRSFGFGGGKPMKYDDVVGDSMTIEVNGIEYGDSVTRAILKSYIRHVRRNLRRGGECKSRIDEQQLAWEVARSKYGLF